MRGRVRPLGTRLPDWEWGGEMGGGFKSRGFGWRCELGAWSLGGLANCPAIQPTACLSVCLHLPPVCCDDIVRLIVTAQTGSKKAM